MCPSSTSSSRRCPRGWWSVAAFVLAAMVAAEAALRVPAVRLLLPARTHYYHASIAQRLDDLEQVVAAHGGVDVLFVGSSIVRADVHPLMFDRVFEPDRLVSFNAAMDGIWPAGVELYLRNLWLEAARPRVVVQGIRFPELRVTTPAKHESQIWAGTVEAGWRRDNVFATAASAMAQRLRVLQYRRALTNTLHRYAAGAPGRVTGDVSIRGHEPRPVSFEALETMKADLSNDGSCGEGACDPGFAAIRLTRDAARQAGADYVLLNVPEHGSRWSGTDGASRYRQYLDSVRAFAGVEGIPFVDPTEGDPFRFDAPHAYADLSHMTSAAAGRFSTMLAGHLRSTLAPEGRQRVAAPPPIDSSALRTVSSRD